MRGVSLFSLIVSYSTIQASSSSLVVRVKASYMSSVGDKDIKQEATAFLASIMDADDQDLGKAATKVEWQQSPIPTSQIISIAAQLKAI
jgi:hypothetical protein